MAYYTVALHNDGKEKYQSFEASLKEPECICGTHLMGFGASREEAIEELRTKVQEEIKRLQEIDYDDVIPVDCLGKPLTK